MADVVYNSFKRDIMNGSIDLDTDTINVMLCTASYTPDQDLHTKRSDVTNEVAGTGYSAGGQALAGKAVTVDNTDNEGVWDANDVTWTTATITGARWAVYYKARGGASTADELIVAKDFGSDKSSSGADFVLQHDAEGILNAT